MKPGLKSILIMKEIKIFLTITGGGTGAISQILDTGGASPFFVGASIPYSTKALEDYLGVKKVESYCSKETARQMAVIAFQNARLFANGKPIPNMKGLEYGNDSKVWGIACTASLAKETERPDRTNKAFIAAHGLKGTFEDYLEFDHEWVNDKIKWEVARKTQEDQLASHIANDFIQKIIDYYE